MYTTAACQVDVQSSCDTQTWHIGDRCNATAAVLPKRVQPQQCLQRKCCYLAVGGVLDDAPHVAALHAFDAHYTLVHSLNTPEATCSSTRATNQSGVSCQRSESKYRKFCTAEWLSRMSRHRVTTVRVVTKNSGRGYRTTCTNRSLVVNL